MTFILNIETSATACSVALSAGGTAVFERSSLEGPSHASLLGLFIEEAVDYLSLRNAKPAAVAVSSGPGSYTGLRIGVSMAKGLCMGWGIPLIAIPTLQIMALRAIRELGDRDVAYCPMIDARRMEVYAALFDAELQPIRTVAADVVTETTYAPYLDGRRVCFFGNGAAKCRPLIDSPNAIFIDDIYPLAADMAPLAEAAHHAARFEDVAYFEPFYLKEFVATTPKNKVLGH